MKVVILLLVVAWLFDYPRTASLLLGTILSIVIAEVFKRKDKISMFDFLAGGCSTLSAALLFSHTPLASGLLGIALGIIVISYVLAPGSSSLRRPLGRMLGILIGVLGIYFVSYSWPELLAGLVTGILFAGFLFAGFLFGVPKQPLQAQGDQS